MTSTPKNKPTPVAPLNKDEAIRTMLNELCWLAQAYEAKTFGGDEMEAAIDDRTQLIKAEIQKQVTLGKIEAYEDCGSKGGNGETVRSYAKSRVSLLQAGLNNMT